MILLQDLPNKPGCYLYKDSKGIIIYVGKAKNIKKRVSSYFQKNLLDEKTKQLVKRIATMDYIITDTEVEALLLENSLIKKHTPKYNINLKDSKQYAYLELTNEEYPRLLVLRDKTKAQGQLFGPFVSGTARAELQQFLIKTFKIRTCTTLPKRACLRYHLGICDAPCIHNISKEEYDEEIAKVASILKGHTSEVRKELLAKMKQAAQKEAFEQAQKYKEQLDALTWLEEKQHVQRKEAEEDIINYHEDKEQIYLVKFAVRKGLLEEKQSYLFDKTIDWYESFITSYYTENDVPKELILPKKISATAETYLSLRAQRKIKVTIPLQGTKKSLLDLAKTNIMHEYFQGEERTRDLKEQLNLDEVPVIIECFDISHLSGTHNVASMVQFKNGRPNKNNYRRYKLSTEVNDDFIHMHEVVYRRYKRLLYEKKELPGLIVIDGGKGQLSAAQEALRDLGLKLPIISLAKKEEEIYLPNEDFPLRIKKTAKGLLLLRAIRDEAHRFAISYNRLLRKKELTA